MKTHILLTIEHNADIPDVTDIVAGRVYTVFKERNHDVVDVTATLIEFVEPTYCEDE